MQALKAIGALDRLRELLEVVRVVGCLKEFRGLPRGGIGKRIGPDPDLIIYNVLYLCSFPQSE